MNLSLTHLKPSLSRLLVAGLVAGSVASGVLGAGCAAQAEPSPAGTPGEVADEADLTAANKKALTAAVRAAYEKLAQDPGNDKVFADEKPASPKALARDALAAYSEYDRTTNEGLINNGPPVAKVGHVNGFKVFFVSGDVSDTGSYAGFYDSKGNTLAVAYSGQGEHPNAQGVDWAQ
jgi:hypothetical protein